MKKYSESVKNEAKLLYVEKEYSCLQISKYFGGNPKPQTILNWLNIPDREGKTWRDLRQEKADQQYMDMTPQSMARKIMEKLYKLLSNDEIEIGKLGDNLAKIQSSLAKITDPRLQVPVMYAMLQDFILYCKKNHPELMEQTGKELLEAIRGFKNHVRARLEKDVS